MNNHISSKWINGKDTLRAYRVRQDRNPVNGGNDNVQVLTTAAAVCICSAVWVRKTSQVCDDLIGAALGSVD